MTYTLNFDAKVKVSFTVESSHQAIVTNVFETFKDGDPALTGILNSLPSEVKAVIQDQYANPESFSNFVVVFSTLQGFPIHPISQVPVPSFAVVGVLPINAPLELENVEDIKIGQATLAVPEITELDNKLIESAIYQFARNAYFGLMDQPHEH